MYCTRNLQTYCSSLLELINPKIYAMFKGAVLGHTKSHTVRVEAVPHHIEIIIWDPAL